MAEPSLQFSGLPVEIALLISKNLSLRDRLSLSDTSRASRLLFSDDECASACGRAGLSVATDASVSARAMAKLLVQPRVGVCNWSEEEGEPKTWGPYPPWADQPRPQDVQHLNFSKVWPLKEAVRKNQAVHLHPVFEPPTYHFLKDTDSFQKVHIRVAGNQPEILLCRHRLYLHEYATCPPLDELHVMIKEDERPIEQCYVAFRVSLSSG
jgi:hypothetical protein